MQGTQGSILEGLLSIPFPGSGISLGDLNLVQSIEDSGKDSTIRLSFPSGDRYEPYDGAKAERHHTRPARR